MVAQPLQSLLVELGLGSRGRLVTVPRLKDSSTLGGGEWEGAFGSVRRHRPGVSEPN